MGGTVTLPDSIGAVLQTWRNRLLDLTFSNPLLELKTRSVLQVTGPEPVDLWLGLEAGQEYAFPLFLGEDDDGSVRSVEGDLVALPSGKALERLLKRLHAAEKAFLEEQGVSVLYLALGLLEWREPDGLQAVHRSPLLLYPVSIHRESANEPFVLGARDDEEAVANPALRQRFLTDFNISLPDLPDDDGDPLAYLTEVTVAIHNFPGWSVSQVAYVGRFSFTKLAMFREIDNFADMYAEHPVISALASGAAVADGIPDVEIDPEHLDEMPLDSTYEVLDADSSQQIAIRKVLGGTHLVIEGPPGTGKSQTITNMIASLIGEGKSVLFVSEKAAALEVVHSRLHEVGLDEFALLVHGKPDRGAIVRDLRRCLDGSGAVRTDEALFAQVERARTSLRNYVRSLHSRLGAAALTPFECYGRLAKVAAAVRLDFEVAKPLEWSQEGLVRLDGTLSGLKAHSGTLQAGEGHPWFGYRTAGGYTLRAQEELTESLERLSDLITKLDEAAQPLAEVLHLSAPGTVPKTRELIALAKLALHAPVTGGKWFDADAITGLLQTAETWKRRFADYTATQVRLREAYNLDSLPQQVSALVKALGDTAALRQLIPDVDTDLSFAVGQHHAATTYVEAYERFEAQLRPTLDRLGIKWPTGPADIEAVRILADALLAGVGANPLWTNRDVIAQTNRLAEEAERHFNDLSHATATIGNLTNGAGRLLTPDDVDEVLKPFDGVLARWLQGGKLRRTLAALSQKAEHDLTYDSAQKLRRALKVAATERAWINAQAETMTRSFGRYAAQQNTDWQRLKHALATAVIIVDHYAPGEVNAEAMRLLCASVMEQHEAKALNSLRDTVVQLAESVGSLRPVAWIAFAGTMQDVYAQGRMLLESAGPALGAAATLVGSRCSSAVGISSLFEEARDIANLRAHERALEEAAEDLATRFGPYFRGSQTDWDEALTALRWCQQAFALSDLSLDQDFQSLVLVGTPTETTELLQQCEDALLAEQDAVAEFMSAFAGPEAGGFASTLTSAPFPQIRAFLAERTTKISELQDWLGLSSTYDALREQGLGPYVDIIAVKGLSGVEAISGFWRRFYLAWLDAAASELPALAFFEARTHRQLVERFRALDEQLKSVHRSRLRARLLAKRPRSLVSSRSAETSIIERESRKQRRLMPLRKLFASIPNLLPQIKPCLMMSPLWVCTLLRPDLYHFDVVIFDEASQVKPEDAIGSVLRAKQIVVVGDPHQLPPSNFFERSEADPAADDDEADSLAFDSVLDLALSSRVPQTRLRWHYRSRHESLIAFSNKEIYDWDLVTFPSAVQSAAYTGVEFVYVPEGVFDRGKSRANQIEARRVAELVHAHVLEHPTKSLGVVTFSRAQMEAIQDEIDRIARYDPVFDQFVSENGPIGFFVKNLERVQGDERDVMFFSTGYGRDIEGRMHFQFGDLGKDGGYRRLNVAITRARDHVKVVSSMLPAELAQAKTQARGVEMLQRYLDYAYHGPKALGVHRDQGTDAVQFDSPLEESVYNALAAIGWDLRTQVGVGGYRIDLGVVHPERPGDFLMGIECDGAAYHGTPTARERDRIRQEVLEGLGWTIERIWAPDWIRHRSEVVAHLQEAYRALLRRESSPQLPPNAEEILQDFHARTDLEEDAPEEHAPEEDPPIPEGEAQVQVVDLAPYDAAPQVELPDSYLAEDLIKLGQPLLELLLREAPIHIDVACRRLFGRTSERRRAAVKITVERQLQRAYLRSYSGEQFIYLRERATAARVLGGRKLSEVSPDEIALVVRRVVENAFSIEVDELLQLVARQYDIARTGSHIQEIVRLSLQIAVSKGLVRVAESRVQVGSIERGAPSDSTPPEGGQGTGCSPKAEGIPSQAPADSSSNPSSGSGRSNADETWATRYLRSLRLEVVDMRGRGGALWVIGGKELGAVLSTLSKKGLRFDYAPKGSVSTGHHPAWYSKDRG